MSETKEMLEATCKGLEDKIGQLNMDLKAKQQELEDANKPVISSTTIDIINDTVNKVLEDWINSNRDNITRPWEIVPSNSASNSIFSLQVEFPRYRSLLLGLPSNNLEDLDSAWESYYQEKYKKASKLFKLLAESNYPSLDAVNGLGWSLLHTKQINKSENQNIDGEMIHKGISQRQFARSFTIADDVKVNGAELKDGLLTIACEKIIPEYKKKKLIEIK